MLSGTFCVELANLHSSRTLHCSWDSDTGDHYPNAEKQKSGLRPFADEETRLGWGSVTQHVGGGFRLSLGWLVSQILPCGFKRAVSPSRTPAFPSSSRVLVALAWDPGACLARRGLVKERASALRQVVLQAET